MNQPGEISEWTSIPIIFSSALDWLQTFLPDPFFIVLFFLTLGLVLYLSIKSSTLSIASYIGLLFYISLSSSDLQELNVIVFFSILFSIFLVLLFKWLFKMPSRCFSVRSEGATSTHSWFGGDSDGGGSGGGCGGSGGD